MRVRFESYSHADISWSKQIRRPRAETSWATLKWHCFLIRSSSRVFFFFAYVPSDIWTTMLPWWLFFADQRSAAMKMTGHCSQQAQSFLRWWFVVNTKTWIKSQKFSASPWNLTDFNFCYTQFTMQNRWACCLKKCYNMERSKGIFVRENVKK